MSEMKVKVVIVGGGTGGITVAARLSAKIKAEEIIIIEPNTEHYYQPMWTLVGAGVLPKEDTARAEQEYIPKGVKWLKEKVVTIDPDTNSVITDGGAKISYEYLVLSPGVKNDWSKIEGLEENLGKNGVCSNYDYDTVDSTWEAFQNFKGGTAIFTMAPMPIKCPGAPQKIMWLADDYFRKQGIRDKSEVIFVTGGGAMFGLDRYKLPLEQMADDRKIRREYFHKLVLIDGENKIATFEHVETGEKKTIPYDMIHVTPPMSAPDFIKESKLADQDGWVDVDGFTMQHKKYPNVFGLGDAANSPNSKTGAAIRKQAPVLVQNMLAHMKSTELVGKYNGYASCPLVTSYNTCMLAEFGYDGKIMETFSPLPQNKPRHSMYFLKRWVLPKLYWDFMLRGKA